jgi:hypothetical protein
MIVLVRPIVANERLNHNRSKQSIRFRVSPPHPSRLLVNAVEPFKSQGLEYCRSATNFLGKNVEGTANTHNERNVQGTTVRRQESLLARRRHTDEQAISAAAANCLNDLKLLFRLEITVHKPSKANARMSFERLVRRSLNNIAAGAEKERLETFSRAEGQELIKKIDAGHTLLDANPEAARGPDNTHTVNPHDITSNDVSGKYGIATHVNKLRNVKRDVLYAFSCAHSLSRQLNGLSHSQNVDGAAQKLRTHSASYVGKSELKQKPIVDERHKHASSAKGCSGLHTTFNILL